MDIREEKKRREKRFLKCILKFILLTYFPGIDNDQSTNDI